METTKLRTLQQRSLTEEFLLAVIEKLGRMPPDARRVLERSELPTNFQRLATRAESDEGAWAAWQSPTRAWLYTGQMSLDPSRGRGQPTLEVKTYDENGRLQNSAVWARGPAGTWQRSSS